MVNPLKYFKNRTVGLAMGSGGAKGLAHIAVVEYLVSMGIPIDMIAGSSIGAVIGALFCVGAMARFKNDMLKFTLREFVSLLDPSVPRSGLIEGKGFVRFMERYIPRSTRIEDLKTPLAIIATDFLTGKPVAFRSGSVLDALRASVSIPGVLVPVRYRDTLLVDGGVANPLPVNVVRDMGADITIAVNLHPQIKKRGLREFVEASTAIQPGQENSGDIEHIQTETPQGLSRGGSRFSWLNVLEKWIRPEPKQPDKQLPSIFEVFVQSIDIMEYVNTALLLQYNKPSVLIEPNLLDINTLDFTDAKKIMAEGHRACEQVRKQLERKVRARV